MYDNIIALEMIMRRKQMGVYCIWHENKPGIFYIGSSLDLESRLNCHKRELRENKHFNPRLQNVFSKYGIDGFRYKILESTYSSWERSTLEILEYQYIKLYDEEYSVYNVYKDRSQINVLSLIGRVSISENMKTNNPMYDPETAKKVTEKRLLLYPASKVRQYDKSGKLIKIWNNTEEAAKYNEVDGSNISRACNENRSCNNFIFIYDNEESISQIEKKIEYLKDIKYRYCSNIYKISKCGLIIKEFESVELAAKDNNVDETNIYRAANNEAKSSAGFIWIFKSDYTEELVNEKVKALKTRKAFSKESNIRRGMAQSIEIVQINPLTEEEVARYASIKKASEEIGIDASNISRAASGSVKSCAGFIWIYGKDYSEELKQEKLDKFFKRTRI
jgi:hypothetical protein